MSNAKTAAPILAFLLTFGALAYALARLVDRFPPMP